MNNIYLREIRLKDFRTFGDLTLPISPGPGLTLLVGTNGLGKSSFFDGIEWCLTGTVMRFQDYIGRLQESDYLTRRDTEAGLHQVSLTFSEGEPLVRSLREQPDASELLGMLKDPSWNGIDDLAAYLGFTHFLGQASQQRFTSRGQADQWQALKGPSGIDRLESIRAALRGRSTTLAFSRRVEREESVINAATRALEEWQRHADRLAELEARGAAAGAQAEATLIQRLSEIERHLPRGDRAPTDFAERLSITRAAIEAEQRQLAGNRVAIEGLRSIHTRFSEASTLTGLSDGGFADADAAVTKAATQLNETMLAASRAEQLAAAQAEIVARAEAEHDASVRVRSAIAQFGLLETERQAAHADEAMLKAERDTCQAEVTSTAATLASLQEAQATLNRLNREEASLQKWATRATALHAQEGNAQTQRKAAIDAKAAADQARNQLSELQRSYDDARDAQARADERLTARRRDASQLAELLSGLAAHIADDDTCCPVCASNFPVGELQTRARNALAAQDVQLADEFRAHDALCESTKAAAQMLAHAQFLISNEVSTIAAAEAAEAAVASERASVAEGLEVRADTDFVSLIADRLGKTARLRAANVLGASAASADVASANSRVDTLASALESLNERLETAAQRRAQCETAIRVVEENLGGYPKPWSIEAAEAAIKSQRVLVDDARANLEKMALARAATANSETAIRGRLAAAKAERDRIVSAVRDAEAARITEVHSWKQAGMEGEPSLEAIKALEVALSARAGAMARYLEDASALSRSYEAFLAQDALRALRGEMDRQGGQGAADNPSLYAQQLQERLEAARAALQLTTATRDAVVAYGDQLKAEAESFSTQFLLPLNDLIDGFNRALLSTAGATVQFSAGHTVARTSLAMQLRYADAVDNAQYRTTLPPQLVLSEGQMAANGFSILCAASTAYRWSRWRALLLDDPLQHNDIIHAAAFVDVMRNLVELERYQLIMSTHNRDEGEFIARKFDAAGLACTVVELLGASKDGVRVAQPRHNVAARRQLAEPNLQVGSFA